MKSGIPYPNITYGAFLLLGVLLLTMQAYSVRQISHDDAISYLAATGHQGEYAEALPQGRWVEAKQWQRFWTPDQFWCFTRIGRDLAAYDIHPPFYFWLLHLWTSIIGVTLAAGPLLNIPFHLIACLAITASCRLLGCSRWTAAAAGLLWLFGGANLAVAAEARQYSLLGAIAALFPLALLHLIRNPTLPSALWLCLASATGMLTHYHFFILFAACVVLATFHTLLTRQWRTLFMIGISGVVSLSVFIALHPTFYRSFRLQARQAQDFAWTEVPQRIQTVFLTLCELFVPNSLAHPIINVFSRYGLPILVFSLISGGACIYLARRLDWRRQIRLIARIESLPFIAGAGCFVVVALLYISCRSPRHAMGAEYLMLVTPLFFVALGQFVSWLTHSGRTWPIVMLACLSISQLTYGVLTTRETIARSRLPQSNPLQKENTLVLDSTARGVLPTVLWHADPAMPVLAAPQEVLIANGIPGLPDHGVLLYISDLEYGNSEAGRESVLQILSNHGFVVTQDLAKTPWLGETYRLIRADQGVGSLGQNIRAAEADTGK